MKRFGVPLVGALLLTLLLAACSNDYAKPPVEIRGATNMERAASIALAVQEKYKGYVAVPASDIGANPKTGEKTVFYLVMITVPVTTFSVKPQTRDQAAAQADAHNKVDSALSDLLSLSTKYLLASDPTIDDVVLQIDFPDTQIALYTSSAEELKAITQDAPVDAWLETLKSIKMTPTK
jgi:hypothetical protein